MKKEVNLPYFTFGKPQVTVCHFKAPIFSCPLEFFGRLNALSEVD